MEELSIIIPPIKILGNFPEDQNPEIADDCSTPAQISVADQPSIFTQDVHSSKPCQIMQEDDEEIKELE